MSKAVQNLAERYQQARAKAPTPGAVSQAKLRTLQELIKQLQVSTRIYAKAMSLEGTGKVAKIFTNTSPECNPEEEVMTQAQEQAKDAKADLDEILRVVVEVANDDGRAVLADSAQKARNSLDTPQLVLATLMQVMTGLLQWFKALFETKPKEPAPNAASVEDVAKSLTDAASEKTNMRDMAYGVKQAAQEFTKAADAKALQLAEAAGVGKLVIFSAEQADDAAEVQFNADKTAKAHAALR